MKLSMPVICECGFNTMDAEKAVKHAEQHAKCESCLWKYPETYLECKAQQFGMRPEPYDVKMDRRAERRVEHEEGARYDEEVSRLRAV